MRRHSWPLLGLLILLAPTLATAQGVDLQSGQKVSAEMHDGGEEHLFRFHAIEGDLITIKFTVPKKSGLEPFLKLIGPEDDFDLPDLEKGKMTLKKLVIPETGLHEFMVAAAGTGGAYGFTFQQKHAKVAPETLKLAAKYSVYLPAGAKLTLDVKAEKGSDLYPGIDRIVDPAGNDILDPLLLKEKKKKARAKVLSAPVFGHYTVYLAAREGDGNAVIKAKIKPAKPWTKKLNESNVFESMVAMVRHPDGMGWDYELNAEVMGPGARMAYLEFPEGSGYQNELLVDDDGDLRYTGGGTFPDGIYTIVVTLQDGNTVSKRFLLDGSWPDPAVIAPIIGISATPTISWTGAAGAGMIVLEVEEVRQGNWQSEYFTLVPGNATSHTVPDGPLDPVPHGVQMYVISPGLKATASSWRP